MNILQYESTDGNAEKRGLYTDGNAEKRGLLF